MPYNYWSPDSPYVEIIPVIEANTEPGSIIGFTGGGDVGYFIHDRTIINMDGLINSPLYFQTLKNGTTGEYLNDLGLDYVFANPIMLESRPYKGQFDPYLERTGIIFSDKELMRFSAPQ